jgi:RHS repeat-associated protein
MPLIAQSIVMEERFVDYDPAGNVRYTIGKERYDTATGTGPLKDHGAAQPQARVSYVASYPDAIGRTVATANYGTNGNLAWTRTPLIPSCTDDVLVNLTAFNPKGEPFQTTDPMLAVTTRTWDAAGRLIEDLVGRVPGRTHPAIDRKAIYEYNADGNITMLKARNNTASGIEDQETVWAYGVTTAGGSAVNSNLLVRTKTYPDSAGSSDVVTYTYNRPGQVTSMKDQAGLVHTYKLDALGRQTGDEVTSWGSSTVDQTIKQLTTGYDARGLVVSAKSFGTGSTLVNSVAFRHNGWRQLIEETQSHEGGTARSIVYGYATGVANTIRRISMTYPSGQSSAPVQNYIYTGAHANELSRVSAIRDGGTDIISYKWLGVGNPVDINYNVPATHLSYGTAADHYAGLDRFGRPISVPWLKDGSAALVHAQYRYDRSSNRQWRRDAAAHAAGVATEDQWYEYDGLYQVGEFQRGTLSGSYPNFSGITPVAQNQDWNYDAMGNWLGFQNDALNQTRQFNKVNEITSINGPSGVVTPQYDPVGNMTSMPAVNNWTTAQTLKWDAWNRLVRVGEGSSTIAEYSYDALFRRISKTVSGTTRRFYYSDQWQILEEYVGAASNPEVRFWYGIRDINDIARRQRYSSGTFLYDDISALRETMNVVAFLDSSSVVRQRVAYDAFGNARFLNNSWENSTNELDWNLLFHGHYRDSETSIYQKRFRNYHPHLGVWLGQDPIGYLDGTNLYLFTSNSPFSFYDPHGLEEVLNFKTDVVDCCGNSLNRSMVAQYIFAGGVAAVAKTIEARAITLAEAKKGNKDSRGYVEYGGRVCAHCESKELRNWQYYITEPARGTMRALGSGDTFMWDSDYLQCNDGDITVGLYHSHPPGNPMSADDMTAARGPVVTPPNKPARRLWPYNIPIGATRTRVDPSGGPVDLQHQHYNPLSGRRPPRTLVFPGATF